MIFDSIRNKENYKSDPELYQALCYLDTVKAWEDCQPNTVIRQEVSFANPVSFISKDEKDCVYEAHRKYIDLHYIVEGVERIDTADVKGLSVHTPFSEEKDIGFYTGQASGTCYLHPGDFMVCFPSDAHKVAMMDKAPDTVKKIVVKIKARSCAVSPEKSFK